MYLLQVDEVKNIMVDNIEKVLERGEKIELLVDKSENLRDRVSLFSNLHFPSQWSLCVKISFSLLLAAEIRPASAHR